MTNTMFSRFHVVFVIKRLFYIEFRVLRKKNKRGVRGAEKAQKGYGMLGNLGCDRDFLGCDRAFGSMSRYGYLCRDILLRLQEVVGSRQSCFLLFFCSNRGPHCVVTVFCFMSRQCRDKGSLVAIETTEARGQGCDRSLVKAKRFHVVTDICSVTTGFHRVVS